MATIINNPGQGDASGDSATGVIIGVLIAIAIIVILFVVYALPAINNKQAATGTQQPSSTNVNVTLPGATQSNQAPAGASGSTTY
ncbi:MAG: hypothetical protein JWO73_400 [Candidatus Taylorbacteria bacterium]|nr:hypothetical protein [Candidatus Taylorbacteria bacterium]